MTVVPGIDALERSLGRLFVVVGVFDGLHRGHEYLLGELGERRGTATPDPTVITFDHHPDEILTGKAPPLLCDPDERLQRLEAAGVEVTVVQTFDVALRMTPFDAFVRRVAARVELAGFLMTPDSAFGYERGGTPETVAALGRDLGYSVALVPPFTLDGRAVSSSDIRRAIAAGDLPTATRLLGRAVAVAGVVDRPATAQSSVATVRFPLPVALPPSGTYAATVVVSAGEALSNGRTLIATEATVEAGVVLLGSIAEAPVGSRVTVDSIIPADHAGFAMARPSPRSACPPSGFAGRPSARAGVQT